MKNNKQQALNTAYNKAFKFRFYPDSEQISLLEHYFGSARFVFNRTLHYNIKHKGYPQFKKKLNRNSFRIVGKNSIHFNPDGSFTLPKFNKHLDIRFSRSFDRDKVMLIEARSLIL